MEPRLRPFNAAGSETTGARPVTLLRAPRMDAQSGVWLEGLTKSEAQTLLVVIPWAVVVGAALLQVALYVLEMDIPSIYGGVEGLKRVVHFLSAVLCAAYVLVGLLCERGCRLRRWLPGPRRTREGWLALLGVFACAAFSLAYVQSGGSLQLTRSMAGPFFVVHGPLLFRVAATVEFALQLVWLWAADHLRFDGRATPRWSGWARFVVLLLWSFTFCGPMSAGETPSALENAFVLAGYMARVVVFVYCLAHVCRRNCTRHCCCCCGNLGDILDWRVLEDTPCSPGRGRLRCLTYFLLTRPPFLLLVNLPLGYPLAFGATFASTVRCGLALLLAVALRPAPHSAIGQHGLEIETRRQFDIAVAMRLCDYAIEAYYQEPPPPTAITVSGGARKELNGEYLRESGRDASGFPIYSQHCGDSGGDGDCFFLRRTAQGDEWEIGPGRSSGVRWARVADAAALPECIEGLWFEFRGVGDLLEQYSNPELVLRPSYEAAPRRFQQYGGNAQSGAYWLLVEEEGPLGVDCCSAPEKAEGGVPCEKKEVSIVVAWRGTADLKNVVADASIALRRLPVASPQRSQTPSFSQRSPTASFTTSSTGDGPAAAVGEGGASGPGVGCEKTEVGQRSAKPPLLDLEAQLEEHLRCFAIEVDRAPDEGGAVGSCTLGDVTGSLGVDADPSLLAPLNQAALAKRRCPALGFLCGLLCRCCICLCFPFRAGSDMEEDDEECSVLALRRLRAHAGFAHTYNSVRAEVIALLLDRLEALAAEGCKVTLYVAGHSLGGAVATLFALDVASSPVLQSALAATRVHSGAAVAPLRRYAPIVYTFGGPRPGNAAFRSIYNALVPDTFRVVASRDVVPAVPPSIAYRQLGREVWLDDAGELTFVMSWAMRHILPARDNPGYHPTACYFRLLDQAYRRATGGPLLF